MRAALAAGALAGTAMAFGQATNAPAAWSRQMLFSDSGGATGGCAETGRRDTVHPGREAAPIALGPFTFVARRIVRRELSPDALAVEMSYGEEGPYSMELNSGQIEMNIPYGGRVWRVMPMADWIHYDDDSTKWAAGLYLSVSVAMGDTSLSAGDTLTAGAWRAVMRPIPRDSGYPVRFCLRGTGGDSLGELAVSHTRWDGSDPRIDVASFSDSRWGTLSLLLLTRNILQQTARVEVCWEGGPVGVGEAPAREGRAGAFFPQPLRAGKEATVTLDETKNAGGKETSRVAGRTVRVLLFDALGREAARVETESENGRLRFEAPDGLTAGNYFYRILDGGRVVSQGRFLLAR